MQERRGRSRASFEGWVEITTRGRRKLASGRDLSAGGMSVSMTSPLPPTRTPVTSEFALPGISLPLALEAVVAWSDPQRGLVGLCFDGVDTGLIELIEGYLEGRL